MEEKKSDDKTTSIIINIRNNEASIIIKGNGHNIYEINGLLHDIITKDIIFNAIKEQKGYTKTFN